MKLVGRRLLKVYLDAEDFTRVTARANEERQAVSEYVRELVLEDLDAAGEFERVQRTERVPVATGSIAAPERLAGRRTHRRNGGTLGAIEDVAHEAIRSRDSRIAGSSDVAASAGKPEGATEPSRKGKYCAHGTQKGYRCWQCGGMAIIE
jgi:hypothetical protein